MADVEKLSEIAVDIGLRVHKALGPGLLESVYETVLAAAFAKAGLKVERQKPISFSFEGMDFKDAFRIDLLIEDCLIIEVKSVETLSKAHRKQLLTYLRLTNQPLGLLMNFNGATFVEGCHRVVNNHQNFASSRLRVNQIKPPVSQQNPDWDSFFDREPCPDFPDVNEKYDDSGRPISWNG
jgi:GxxExxY protein